jgi:hypothetical protein
MIIPLLGSKLQTGVTRRRIACIRLSLLETFSPDPFNWDVPFQELAKGFDVAVPSMKRLSFEVPRLLIQMFCSG